MLLTRKDLGSHIAGTPECAIVPASITSGAGNNNVAVTGNVIDRLIAGRSLAQSCSIFINWIAVLTNTKTLAITASVKHAAAQAANALTAGVTLVPQIMRARYAEGVAGAFAGVTSSPALVGLAWSSTVPAAGVVGPVVVSTGVTSFLTRIGVMQIDLNLSEANRYIAVVLTLNLNNGATDTVVASAIVVLGGVDEEPAL